MSTQKQSPPMLERDDTVYARHPRHGAIVVKVLATGKDGYTAEDGDGRRHKLTHDSYLGHQKRVIPTFTTVDVGVDGSLVEDQRGMRRFIKGDLPPRSPPAEPSDNHASAGGIDDPLLDGLNILKKAFLTPIAPLPAGLVLLLKATTDTPAAGRAGLALRPITDSRGRRTSRWVKTSADQKKERLRKKPDETTDPRTPHQDDKPVSPALHKHGDTVAFRHGDTEGTGKIVGSGADGVTVQTEDGREHMVRHEHLLPDHPEQPKPAASGPADAQSSQEPVPPEHFKAVEIYAKNDDPNVTPETVLDDFPPDTAGKMRQAQLKLDAGQQTQDLFKKGGEYTPERQAVHDRIAKTFLSEAKIKAATPARGTPPTFTILGGRGGSGKSWFEGNVFDPKTAIVLDADKIKQALPEYDGWNAALLHEESGDLFDAITVAAQAMGLNLVHDATMKTASKAVALVASFKERGYRVEAHYMFLPRQEAAKRAVARFLGPTARLVPPEVILANTGNEKSFDAVKELVDAWSFRDNNVGRNQQPILLSEKIDDSEAGADGRHGQQATTGKGDQKPISGQARGRSPGGGGPFEGGHYAPASASQAQKAIDLTSRVMILKTHIPTYTKQDGTVVIAHEDQRPAAKPQHPMARGFSLSSGTRITSMNYFTKRFRDAIPHRERLRRELRMEGRAANGQQLSPADVEELAERLERHRAEGIARQREEFEKRQEYLRTPEGMAEAAAKNEAARLALAEEDRIRTEAHNRLVGKIRAILASPGAAMWQKNRLADVKRFAEKMPSDAIREAKAATLEAVSRRARTSWGFELRHTSASSGRADSRYLVIRAADGTPHEVRLSDHEIPETAERFDRSINGRGPRWSEIVIDDKNILWGEARWRAVVESAAGVREYVGDDEGTTHDQP